MALLTWNDKLSVGVKSLDDQHTILFESLNELHAAMMKGQAKKMTDQLLRDLVAYTREHFAAEESVLKMTKYPALAQHQSRHRELAKQVKDYTQRFERGEITLNMHLLVFLRDWLTDQIQKDDRAYSDWLNQHGVR